MNIKIPYFDLCLLKMGPAEMPVSRRFLYVSLCVYYVIGIMIGLTDSSFQQSVIVSMADTLFMSVATMVLLTIRGFAGRFQQTLSAMAVAGSYLGLISLPVLVWFYSLAQIQRPNSMALFFVFVMMIWGLTVTAHIFRQALEIRPFMATLLSITYMLIDIGIVGLIMSGTA